jgi:hypothetical protein
VSGRQPGFRFIIFVPTLSHTAATAGFSSSGCFPRIAFDTSLTLRSSHFNLFDLILENDLLKLFLSPQRGLYEPTEREQPELSPFIL